MLVGYKSFGNCGNPLTSGELWVEGCPDGRAPRARLSQKGRSILSPLLPTPTLGQCSIKALLLIKPPVVLFVNASFPEYGCFLLPLWAGLWDSKLWNPPHHLQGEMVKRAGRPIIC